MIRIINKLTGRLFWFNVRVQYVVNDYKVLYIELQIGLEEKSNILNYRMIRKMVSEARENHI